MWLFLNIIFLGWWLRVGLAQFILLDGEMMAQQQRNVTEPWPTGPGSKYQKLAKPAIRIIPSWITDLNGNVSINCKAPRAYNLIDFYLWKKGRYSWKARVGIEDMVDFPVINVTQLEIGWYYCAYCVSTRQGRLCSAFSEDANITIIDPILPKPFAKVIPQELLLTDLNASIACRVPKKGLTVTLFKSGSVNETLQLSNKSDTAFFILLGLKVQDSGNYSCRYFAGLFILSVLSDPVQLIVKELPTLTLWTPLIAALLTLSLILPSLIALLLLKRRRDAILRRRNQPVEDTNQPEKNISSTPMEHTGSTPMEHTSSTLVEKTSSRQVENTSSAQSTSAPWKFFYFF